MNHDKVATLFDSNREYTLELGKRKYRLIKVAGCGGSSIVYKAREEGDYTDFVVIKEFCPHNLKPKRMADGSISVPDDRKVEAEYKERKSRAENEPKTVHKLRHDDETQNNNPRFLHYDKPIEANNTLYTVIDTESGDMLSDMIANDFFKGRSFLDVCDCILEVLAALKPIHDKKCLHLDISPDNILFSDLKEHAADLGIAKLIDYNSAFWMDESTKNWLPSYKPGYSANELTDYSPAKPPALSFATDLYSVAAIFFELMVGRTPEHGDASSHSKRQKAINESGYLAGASNILVAETNRFLEKGLSLTAARRFKDVDEMREAVGKLRELRTELQLVKTSLKSYKHFVGRESELKKIHDNLKDHNYLFLEGMGGIGKTELVKEYIATYGHEYHHAAQFVRYGGSLFSTIVNALKFHNFDDAKYESTYGKEDAAKYIFRDKMDRLKKYDGGVLIVVDNYNIAADPDFEEFTRGNCKIIFTSRVSHDDNKIEVEPMESQSLLELFHKYYAPRKLATEKETVVSEIIKLVNGHTMTVMLIARAMREDDEITPEEMLERLSKSFDAKLPTTFFVNKEDVHVDDREQEMYQHVLALFDMAEIVKSDIHAYIMTNMSIVPYTGLKRKTFFEWTGLSRYYESNEHGNKNNSDLKRLIERRWIQLDEDTRVISLHPVISDVANGVLAPDSQKCGAFIKSLIKFAEDNKGKTHIEWARCMNTLELACKRITDETEVTANLCYSFASVANSLADYDIAMAYLSKVSGIREKTLGKEHPDTAATYNNIALVYLYQGDYPTALEWFHKALPVSEKVLGKEHPDTATTYNNIALVCSKQGDYPKALELCHRALAVYKKVLGKEHPKTATTHNSIASVYFHQGDYPKALEWFHKALAVYEKVLVKKHADTATTYNNIAHVCLKQGDYLKALEWFHKALAVREKVLGKEHPNTATTYNSIATVYLHQGDYPKALEWYHKALAVKEQVLGKEHPDTATTYNNIAIVCSKQGNYPKALEWFHKALAVYKKVLGKKHPSTATTYNNIADVYSNQGDYHNALEWFHKALTVCEKVLGKEHPDTATTYNNIALVCSKQGDYPKALELCHRALAVYKKVLGKEHPSTATTYNNIATVYYSQGDYPKVLEWFHKALAVYEKVQGKEHADTATIYNNIAGVHSDQGDYHKALEWFHKAFDVYKKVLGKDHPSTATTYNNIAGVYSDQGDYHKALEWYHKALAVCEKVLGKEHPKTAATYNNIALIYSNQGDYPKALELCHKALTVCEKVLGKDHPSTATTYNNIASAYFYQRDYHKALEWYHKALAVYEKVLGKDHPDTATTYNNIAGVYSNQGDYPKALEWYYKTLAVREKAFGKEHPKVIELYNDIARLEEKD